MAHGVVCVCIEDIPVEDVTRYGDAEASTKVSPAKGPRSLRQRVCEGGSRHLKLWLRKEARATVARSMNHAHRREGCRLTPPLSGSVGS